VYLRLVPHPTVFVTHLWIHGIYKYICVHVHARTCVCVCVCVCMYVCMHANMTDLKWFQNVARKPTEKESLARSRHRWI